MGPISCLRYWRLGIDLWYYRNTFFIDSDCLSLNYEAMTPLCKSEGNLWKYKYTWYCITQFNTCTQSHRNWLLYIFVPRLNEVEEGGYLNYPPSVRTEFLFRRILHSEKYPPNRRTWRSESVALALKALASWSRSRSRSSFVPMSV